MNAAAVTKSSQVPLPLHPKSQDSSVSAEICRGLIHVTADSFFATIGQMNVHPRAIAVAGKWGIASEWDVVNSREVIAKSVVRTYAEQAAGGAGSDYFVTASFLAAHPTLRKAH